MKLKTHRQLHRWTAILTLLPLGLMMASGVLLQFKKDWTWIQPATQRGAGTVPAIGFEAILEACRGVEEAGIQGWTDIDRLDVRPGRGVVKVQGKNHWEIQVDTETGRVLQAAYRRSDWIEALHDGSALSPAVKRWIFLPAGIVALVLYLTGCRLLIRKKRARAEE